MISTGSESVAAARAESKKVMSRPTCSAKTPFHCKEHGREADEALDALDEGRWLERWCEEYGAIRFESGLECEHDGCGPQRVPHDCVYAAALLGHEGQRLHRIRQR